MLPETNPSLLSFILHRKSFWLGMFTIIFLCWVWYDSTRYLSMLAINKRLFRVYASSHHGSCSFIFGFDSSTLDFFVAQRVDINRQIMFDIFDTPPGIRYIYLILLVFLSTAAWITWRWRKILTTKKLADLPTHA